jgi:hypothetical protein
MFPGVAKEPWDRVKPGRKLRESGGYCFCCCMTVRVPGGVGRFLTLRRRRTFIPSDMNSFFTCFFAWLGTGPSVCLGFSRGETYRLWLGDHDDG